MQVKNPWTVERLAGLIGQEESYKLEFKSSRPLLGKSKDIDNFFDDLSADVSAFLNSDGGDLVIGIEEVRGDKDQAGKADRLSDGVPRGVLTPDVLERKLCGRIQPAVASYVRAFSVKIGERDGADLLAYIVEVKPGMTAYQAQDKRYHGRRSFSTFQMDDKDVRLRMLTDDRPRAALQFAIVGVEPASSSWSDIERASKDYSDLRDHLREMREQEPESGTKWTTAVPEVLCSMPESVRKLVVELELVLINIGNVTIRRGAIRWDLVPASGSKIVPIGLASPDTAEFAFDSGGSMALYPEMSNVVSKFRFSVPRGIDLSTDESELEVVVYLDGGPPVRQRILLAEVAKGQIDIAEQRLLELGQSHHFGPGW